MSSNIRINRICKFCNNEFIARTTTTQYCSLVCARLAYKARKKITKIEVSNKETSIIKSKPIEDLKSKEFLTIRDVTILLNCSRQTVFNIIKRGDLKAVNLSKRKTIIKRVEIDKLFEYRPQLPISGTKPETIFNHSECYNLSEVREKFNISDKALIDVIKRNNIQKFRSGKFAFVPKNEIDKIFLSLNNTLHIS